MKQTATTKAARGEACTLNVSGVCQYERETVVFCHFRQKSKVAEDRDWGAFGCHPCHAHLDQNKGMLEDRQFYWLRGIQRTQARLFERGIWK